NEKSCARIAFSLLLLVYHSSQKSEILIKVKTVKKACFSTDLFGCESFIGFKSTTIEKQTATKKLPRESKIFFYETVKLCPTYAVWFYRAINHTPNPNKLPALNKHNGEVSNKAKTKIRNAVNWMLLFTERKFIYRKAEKKTFSFLLNFITLTLPTQQKHTDEDLKELLLTPFIQWLTKTQNAFMWLWKAEAQSNGNIHFHITTHQFVHWKSIRSKWNKLLAKNGYCKVFQDGTNDLGNSATQVKAARNANQVGSYLANYIGKKDKLMIKIKTPKALPTYECA